MYHEYNISKNYPDIRLFLVNIRGSATPLIDFASVGLKWSKPSPRKLFTCCTLLSSHFLLYLATCLINVHLHSLFLGDNLLTNGVLVIKI